MDSLIDEFSLQKVRKNLGMSLSGGERRRTEIARALAVDPNFVLLDEPFAGVDPIAVEEIQSIVSRLKSKNIGILITDHNVDETLSITDRAYLMVDGKLFKAGTAEELAVIHKFEKYILVRISNCGGQKSLNKTPMAGLIHPRRFEWLPFIFAASTIQISSSLLFLIINIIASWG